MKQTFKLIAFLSLSVLFSGCKKDSRALPELLSDKDLTVCPTGGSCDFFYADNSGMNGFDLLLSKGQYRVFWSNTSLNSFAFSLYAMAPMIGDNFVLGKQDFAADLVKLRNNCANCYAIGFVPIDGTIKGQKLSRIPGQPEKWLLQVDIVAGSPADPNLRLPLHLKQYFLNVN